MIFSLMAVGLIGWPGTSIIAAPGSLPPPPMPTAPRGSWEKIRTQQIHNIGYRQAHKPREVCLPPGCFRILTGIAYGPQACQQLDLYLPAEPRFAVVVYIHGGSWIAEDKSYYKVMGEYLAAHGVGAVLINYRLPPATNVAGEIEDAARAVAWVGQNIASHGGDPGRLFLCGHSAGGHLVAVLGSRPELVAPTIIRGTIALEGVYDLNCTVRFFGVAYAFRGVDYRTISPARQVRPCLPPFLLVTAERGTYHMKVQSYQFQLPLLQQGCMVEHFEAPGQHHYDLALGVAAPGALQGPCILEFISRLSQGRAAVDPDKMSLPTRGTDILSGALAIGSRVAC